MRNSALQIPGTRLTNAYLASLVPPRMRYLVRGVVPADVGNKLDASGGPGKLLGYVASRFKPECAYANYEKREIIYVVDFETPRSRPSS